MTAKFTKLHKADKYRVRILICDNCRARSREADSTWPMRSRPVGTVVFYYDFCSDACVKAWEDSHPY